MQSIKAEMDSAVIESVAIKSVFSMFSCVFCFTLKEHLLDVVVLMMYILIMSAYALHGYSYQSRPRPEM